MATVRICDRCGSTTVRVPAGEGVPLTLTVAAVAPSEGTVTDARNIAIRVVSDDDLCRTCFAAAASAYLAFVAHPVM